jgi:hypothetical protein
MRISSPSTQAPTKHPNSGTISKSREGVNARKEYSGKININGNDYWIAANKNHKDESWWYSIDLEHTVSKEQIARAGSLGPNRNKQEDRHPDLKGSLTIAGQKWWLSGWIKEGKFGKFASISANKAEAQHDTPAHQAPASRYKPSSKPLPPPEDDNSDAPF